MQLPSGLLADSRGSRKILPLFMLVAATGCAVFAFGDSFLPLAAGRALTGFAVSVIFVCGLKLISLWFPLSMFARMNGIFLGMGSLSSGFASVREMFGTDRTGTASCFFNTFPSFVVPLLQPLSGFAPELYPGTDQGFPPRPTPASAWCTPPPLRLCRQRRSCANPAQRRASED